MCDGVAMTDWVIDLDGVMWRGACPIAGSNEAIATLLGRGERVLFCTNNSTASGAVRATQLVDQGIPAGIEVVTSADAVCTLEELGERVLVLGSVGLAEVLGAHVSEVVRTVEVASPSGSHPDAPGVYDTGVLGAFDAVVVGLTREFDYAQLDLVSQVVRGGACLLATNADRTFPAADRIQPGTGSLLAAVEAACGVKAIVAGKPEPPMAQLIGDRLGSGSTKALVVGDRPDTDGRLAQQLGLPFALVLSGVTETYSSSLDVPVALVAENLASLVAGEFLAGDARVTAVDGGSASAPGPSAGTSPVHR